MVSINSKLKDNKIRSAVFRVFALVVLFSVFSGNTLSNDGETPAGTVIVNRASANYEDNEGNSYETVSETVQVTVLAVPAVSVTPDETEPSEIIAPNAQVTRVFRVCNTGNSADSIVPTESRISSSATISQIYFDIDNSGTITPGDTEVSLDQTPSPELAPGECINVLYAIETGPLTPRALVFINLSARSSRTNPNSKTYARDSGAIINIVGNGVVLTSPNDPNLPPVKLVEDRPRYIAAPGQTLNYKILFRNRGSVAARQVLIADDLPSGLRYVPQTLRLNGRLLSDADDSDEGTATAARIDVKIPNIAPDAVTQIEFRAILGGTGPSGNGIVNFANLGAENAPSVKSSEAIVVVNPVGVVYAGNSGGGVRIGGAIVTIATDEVGTPLPLNPKRGFETNPENDNPFITNSSGEFSFGLDSNQTGSPNAPVRYFITATAPSFRSRLMEVTIESSGDENEFFRATIRALDGQAVAVPGGFQLTRQTVRIDSLAALVFNIPMFEVSTLEINKSADKSSAQIGDIVTYRVQLKNSAASAIDDVVVRDTLPVSFGYIENTARIESAGNVVDNRPVLDGNTLTFSLGTLAAGASVTISYRVRIGADAAEGTHYNSALANGFQPDGSEVSTSPVRAAVRVRGGVFSMRQLIIGRVFEDRNLNGNFDKGERPVVGARIFTVDGRSVTTDSAGLYSFPAVEAGSIVLSLDPITLPKGYYLIDDRRRRSARGWTRLLNTPLGGGTLLRQNYAIAPIRESDRVPSEYTRVKANGVFVPPDQVVEEAKAPTGEKPVEIANLNKPVGYSKVPSDRSAAGSKAKKAIFPESSATPGPIDQIAPTPPAQEPKKAEDFENKAENKDSNEAPGSVDSDDKKLQKIASANTGPPAKADDAPGAAKYSKIGSVNANPSVDTGSKQATSPEAEKIPSSVSEKGEIETVGDPGAKKADLERRPTPVRAAKPTEIAKPAKNPGHNEPKTVTKAANNDSGRLSQPTKTFTIETTETVQPIAPGEIRVESPETNSIVMTPGLSIVASVTNNWTIEAEVNGSRINQTNIGETRVDNRNNITTYTFVGINLLPGLNKIRLVAVGLNEERGKPVDFEVFGRGVAARLEILPAKNSVPNDGSEALRIEIRAYDRLGNPATDSQIGVATSAGKFYVSGQTGEKGNAGAPDFLLQQVVSLEKGRAVVYLLGENSADTARIKAVSGGVEASADIRFTTDLRPTLLVGIGKFSVGRNAPDIRNSGDETAFRGHFAFYFKGRAFGENLLTLAYNSQRPLNRLAGRDRIGALDPVENNYQVLGDSSELIEGALSNSKVYARIDRGRSYAMFGDMEADMDQSVLAGYSRRLTGVKLHLENDKGDFVSVSGARPNTAFSRDVFPGGLLSVVRLSHSDILPGSEIVTLEVRDRRNPEIVLSRENLVRSVDYNLEPITGEMFFLRPISTFDHQFNLLQVVVTYEYHDTGSANYVYTARGVHSFKSLGLRFGSSYVNQQQDEIGAFHLAGIDVEKRLWKGGRINLEVAISRGRFANGVNVFDFYNTDGGFVHTGAGMDHNGAAVSFKLDQPLPFWNSRLQADYSSAGAGFFNPFGSTVTAGTQRYGFGYDVKPNASRNLHFGYLNEKNKSFNVNNSRTTLSFLWTEQWNDKMRTSLGFDHREFGDSISGASTGSNLVTAGIEYRPTEKIEFSAKREQNLSDADPTYPDQTTFTFKYKLNSNAKFFVTQRLASSPITPIGDFSGNGFSAVGSRAETSVGIETKLSKIGSLSGRYQIENGKSGSDSFAVFGLQNRWKVSDNIALETGFERGFLLKGSGKSFNMMRFGGAWTPAEGFKANARYELRDRNGLGQLFTIGAVGKLGNDWTTATRAQWAFTDFNKRGGSSSGMTAALAYRPLETDKYALLFSYAHRESVQKSFTTSRGTEPERRDRVDRVSADGLYQVKKDLEVYGRFALSFNGNGNGTNVYASSLTYLMQARAQQLIADQFDVAVESRWLGQPGSGSTKRSVGTEIGYWVLPELRIAAGYSLVQSKRPYDFDPAGTGNFKKGFYLTFTTKLSNLFNLFGTSKSGLRDQTPLDGSDRYPQIADKKPDGPDN